mmetsp:Transcript_50154/g.162376  ORF Transcript_50154/g.162376 Transcript_50154/m.162376 type:complete len:792 (+) Transcript_50154:891-3266(+)
MPAGVAGVRRKGLQPHGLTLGPPRLLRREHAEEHLVLPAELRERREAREALDGPLPIADAGRRGVEAELRQDLGPRRSDGRAEVLYARRCVAERSLLPFPDLLLKVRLLVELVQLSARLQHVLLQQMPPDMALPKGCHTLEHDIIRWSHTLTRTRQWLKQAVGRTDQHGGALWDAVAFLQVPLEVHESGLIIQGDGGCLVRKLESNSNAACPSWSAASWILSVVPRRHGRGGRPRVAEGRRGGRRTRPLRAAPRGLRHGRGGRPREASGRRGGSRSRSLLRSAPGGVRLASRGSRARCGIARASSLLLLHQVRARVGGHHRRRQCRRHLQSAEAVLDGRRCQLDTLDLRGRRNRRAVKLIDDEGAGIGRRGQRHGLTLVLRRLGARAADQSLDLLAQGLDEEILPRPFIHGEEHVDGPFAAWPEAVSRQDQVVHLANHPDTLADELHRALLVRLRQLPESPLELGPREGLPQIPLQAQRLLQRELHGGPPGLQVVDSVHEELASHAQRHGSVHGLVAAPAARHEDSRQARDLEAVQRLRHGLEHRLHRRLPRHHDADLVAGGDVADDHGDRLTGRCRVDGLVHGEGQALGGRPPWRRGWKVRAGGGRRGGRLPCGRRPQLSAHKQQAALGAERFFVPVHRQHAPHGLHQPSRGAYSVIAEVPGGGREDVGHLRGAGHGDVDLVAGGAVPKAYLDLSVGRRPARIQPLLGHDQQVQPAALATRGDAAVGALPAAEAGHKRRRRQPGRAEAQGRVGGLPNLLHLGVPSAVASHFPQQLGRALRRRLEAICREH